MADLGLFCPLYSQLVPVSSLAWTVVTTATAYLNATTDKIAYILALPAGTLTEVIVWSGTGGSNADTLDLRVETVSLTDFTKGPPSPSGTLFATGSTASLSTVGGAAAKHTLSINGGAGVVLANTTLVAFVFSVTGSTPDFRFLTIPDFKPAAGGGINISTPYWDGADWRQFTVYPPCIRFNYGGTYPQIPGLPCSNSDTAHGWDNADTPNCRGVVIDLPSGDVGGIRMWQNTGNLKTPPDVVLINAAGTELGRVSQHSYYYTTRHGQHDYFFDTPITVTAGTYRIYMIPTDGVTVSYMYALDFDSAAEANQFVPASLNQSYTSAHNPPSEGGAGSWTDDATSMPLIIPLIDVATGGGGGGLGIRQGFQGLDGGINL